ncbi:Hypothetical protein I595_3677 [Croceitalea dokdonensis DOKDO 023]|uniref:PKD/Chitinase domain-containing protein n=1 Tax=Croceitalea dokdonensis DOKDO 023 TaxID=1300341 RepID=A0A0P7AB11_9FLAO|nr:Hypothetical protein I595_3677 [Croceitalea dokdonensis DOKDO 023]
MTLTVTDDQGATDSDTVSITVSSDVPVACTDYLPNDDPAIVLPVGALLSGADAVVGTSTNTNGSDCAVEVVNDDSGQPWAKYHIPIVLADHGIEAGDRLFIAIDGNDGTGNARFEINQDNRPNTALGFANFGSGWSGYETTVVVPSGLTSLDLWLHSNYTDASGGGTAYYDNLVVVNLDADGSVNISPIADAGQDRSIEDVDGSGFEEVVLDGNGSTDPDGTIVAYSWSDSTGELATGASPSITLAVGTTVLTLTVTDDQGEVDTDTVSITVTSNVAVICTDYLPNEDPAIVLPTGNLLSGADAVVGTSTNTNGSDCAVEVSNTDANQPWAKYHIPIVLADYGIEAGDRLLIGVDGNDGTGNARFEINQDNRANTALGFSNFSGTWSRYETTIVVPSGITSLDLWFHSNYTDTSGGGTALYDNLLFINLDAGGNIQIPSLGREPVNTMMLSPNPAVEEVNVTFDLETEVMEYQVFDLLGRLVRTVRATKQNGQQINVNDLPAGNYFIKATDAEGQQFQKQMVIKR